MSAGWFPIVSAVLMDVLLFADSDDLFWFDRFVARAALGIEELQQLLQSIGIGGAAQKRSLPLYFDQAFGFQFFQMVREGRIRNLQLSLNFADHQAFGMR